MKEPIADFRTRFNVALSTRNVKQSELSERTGLSKSTINHYMSGYTKPKSDKLFILSKALDVNDEWLLGYDVPMERSAIIVGNELQQILFKISNKLNISYDDLFHTFINEKCLAAGTPMTEENLLDFFKRHYSNNESDDVDYYYLNDETRQIAQEAFKNPELRTLFKVARDIPPERLKAHIEFMKSLKEQENKYDDEGC